MKKIVMGLFLSVFLAIPSFIVTEDNHLPKIEIKKTCWGNRYYCSGRRLNLKMLVKQLKKVPQTNSEIKIATIYKIPQFVFSFGGGGVVGYSIGSSADNTDLAVTGCLSTGIGFYFEKIANKHFEKAVEIYNSNI